MTQNKSHQTRFAGARMASALLLTSLAGLVPSGPVLAALPAAKGFPAPALPDSQVSKLLQDADAAVKTGNLNLALIHLRNAVRLAPQNGSVRARMAAVILSTGDAPSAERELRQAMADGGARDFIAPLLLQAMIDRGEVKEILEQYPDPGKTDDPAAADILRARAIALQATGKANEANAAMDRSLALKRDGRGLFTAAQLVRQQGDLPKANTYLDEALKAEPNNANLTLLKIALLRQEGDPEGALTLIDELIKKNPRSEAPHIVRAETLIGMNRDAQAKTEIDELLAKNGALPIGNFYRAVLLSRAKDFTGAWRIASILPVNFVQSQPQIWTTVAAIAVAGGNLESGSAHLTAFVNRYPDAIPQRLMLASVRLRQNEPQEALKVLEPAAASKEPQVNSLLGQTYLSLGRYADAIAAFEKANVRDSDNELLKRQLALSELGAGRADNAIQGLRTIAEKDPGNPVAVGPLIAVLTQTGKIPEAISAVDRMIGANAKSPIPRFYRGQLLTVQGDLSGAAAEYTRSLAIDPKFVPSLYYRANVALRRGDADQATADLRNVVQIDPKNSGSFIRLAEIAIANGREAEAPQLLTQAAQAAPNDPAPKIALTNYRLRQGDLNGAQAAITDLLKVAPNNPEARALQGQLYLAKNDKENAVRTFQDIASANPKSPGAQILLGSVLSGTGNGSGVEDAFKKAVEIDPMSAQARGAQIVFLIGQNRANEAIAAARDFAKIKPGVEADLLLADTFSRLRRYTDAEVALLRSKSASTNPNIVSQLATLYAGEGNMDRALGLYTSWLAKNPNDAGMRQKYATLLLSFGRPADAQKEYEATLKLQPDDPVALNNLAWLLQKNDPERALELAAKSVRIMPQSAEMIDTLGWMKTQANDRAGGLALLQRAYNLSKDNPLIGYHLAVALDKSGKRPEAKTLLQSILAASPSFDGADDAKRLVASW